VKGKGLSGVNEREREVGIENRVEVRLGTGERRSGREEERGVRERGRGHERNNEQEVE